VAFSPKVTGSRIEMPAKGPMPGQHADQGADQAADKGVTALKRDEA